MHGDLAGKRSLHVNRFHASRSGMTCCATRYWDLWFTSDASAFCEEEGYEPGDVGEDRHCGYLREWDMGCSKTKEWGLCTRSTT